MSNAASLKSADFKSAVEEKKGVVLVDFWAAWCGPCMMLSPVIDELCDDYSGKVTIYKANVDDEGELAAKFGIMSIPTLIVFKDGQVFDKITGVVPKEQIAALLDKALA